MKIRQIVNYDTAHWMDAPSEGLESGELIFIKDLPDGTDAVECRNLRLRNGAHQTIVSKRQIIENITSKGWQFIGEV